jgi:glycosyltransferase involved in cell wall biosynthesis
VPTAYSERVARRFGHGTAVVPIALETMPTSIFVDDPVAVLPADWTWAPNLAALTTLLRDWPAVRRGTPGARLLLAGSGLPDSIRTALPGGVEALGQLPDLADLWAQAAVLAFPCPASSGPKVKVLEAAMAGVPVVTTEHGAEGLELDGITVASRLDFSAVLANVLADPETRAAAAQRIRASAQANHGPLPAAAKRLAVWKERGPASV